ncbi:MAG: hypothetical protein QNI87_11665 [Erythrobacter sp.]|uniref:DUF1302 family protein n=1 Tax=Erythrobacter sp. TaxID=1042 RepID=UPI00260F51FF|nr:DUF1302 family protein [Erythrobacter sp.]MDJ0979176.1 hypothetical protein [Erythrobacter sp.]
MRFEMVGRTPWLLIPVGVFFAGQADAQEVSVDNEVELRAALETADEDVQLTQLEWNVRVDSELSPSIAARISGRLRVDGSDRLDPGKPDQSNRSSLNRRHLLGEAGEIELREAFIDLNFEPVSIRLGKQQIVWGQADGLKVLDIVNPQSFREFILEDFDASRIPLWSAKAEVQLGPVDVQVFWIPDHSFHDIPEQGAAFELTSSRFLPPVGPDDAPIVLDDARPSGLKDDFGGQLSLLAGGWDLTFNLLRHHADRPVFSVTAEGGNTIASRVYDRQMTLGGSFAKALGEFVIRGEIGYAWGRAINVTQAANDVDRIVEADALSYVVAVDWRSSDTFISAQFFQDRLIDAGPGLLRPRNDEYATFYLRQTLLRDTLEVDFKSLVNFDDGDVLLRPRLLYDITPSIQLSLAADLFFGKPDGVFGQFEEQSRVSLAMIARF